MTASSSPNPPAPSGDRRPEFRIAVFGLAAHFRELLEIVLRHARHNRYRFTLAESHGPGKFEIALVDMTANGAASLTRTLARVVDRDAVIRVGRRTHPARPRDDLLVQSFVAQVLFALNRAVDQHLRRESTGATAARPGLLVSERGVARRPRVLVVDRSPTARRQLGAALNQMGIDSEAVDSGRAALERLASRRYELVVLDIVMPDMDGYRLTRRMKKDRSLRGMPVVILTARSSPFDLVRGALAGCNSYLVKPVALQSLRDTIIRHLRRAIRRADGGPFSFA
ncbi:MAG: response regulator [Gammaproteobacteria bacterium]